MEDHIDITPPTMEREEYPEPSTTQVEPGDKEEEPLEGGAEDVQVEPTEEELKQAKLKEKALKVSPRTALHHERVDEILQRRKMKRNWS